MGTIKTLLAFAAGAAAGAAAALLLAPDSGKNTREKIRGRADEVAGLAKGRILEGLDLLESVLEEKSDA